MAYEDDELDQPGMSIGQRIATFNDPPPASTGHPDGPTPGTDPARGGPTFGARIAGRKGVIAVAPQAPAPAPVADVPAPSLQLDPSKLPSELGATGQAKMMPPAPPPSATPDLIKRSAELGKPIDKMAVGPDGKPLYRMGIGQRILGTAANALNGFARNGAPPVFVGPGATNARYDREEAMRQANYGNVRTQLGDQQKLEEENRKMFDSATKQAYETRIGEARTTAADAAAENAQTKLALSESQAELNKAKANRADREPDPTNEFSGWYTSFRRDNGRPPTAKEIMDHDLKLRAASKDTSAGDAAKAIQVAQFKLEQAEKVSQAKESERRNRYAEVDKDITTKYDAAAAAAKKKQIDDKLDADYKPKLQAIDDEGNKMLGLTKSGGALQSTPQKQTPPKVGDQITVGGKPHKVIGINKQSGKPIVSPL